MGRLPLKQLSFDEPFPLEKLSLDELLQNVDDNHIWDDDKERVEGIRQEVQEDYLLYISAMEALQSGSSISSAAMELSVSRFKIEGWLKGKVPSSCMPYMRSYLPKTEKERLKYAFVLGVLSDHPGPGYGRCGTLIKLIRDKETRERFSKAIKDITKRKPKIKGDRLRFHHLDFTSALFHIRRNLLEEYVSTRDEREAFRDGYLRTTRTRFMRKKGGLVFVLDSFVPQIIKTMAHAFFDLGVYPYISPDNDRIIIQGLSDLRRLYESGVMKNPALMEELSGYVEEKRDKSAITVPEYYELISLTKKSNKADDGNVDENVDIILSKRFGISRHTIRHWIASIVPINDQRNTPLVVDRYKILCDYLGLPNIYEASEPVKVDDSWFLPTDRLPYVLPKELQGRYLQMYRLCGDFSRDHALHLWEVLKKGEEGDIKAHFREGTNIIERLKF